MVGAFSGGPVLGKLSSSAGDMGLIPGQGTKVPRAAGWLKRARTTEPMSSGTSERQLGQACTLHGIVYMPWWKIPCATVKILCVPKTWHNQGKTTW